MAGDGIRHALRWIERLLLLGAAVCVAWVFMAWKDAAFSQIRARSELAEMLATAAPLRDSGRPPPVADDGGSSLIGVLDIPRVNLSVAVLEGDDDRTLRIAAGHLPGTPLPWDEGNTALAGHRDTFFRPLASVRVGDEIHLATRRGAFRYRVRRVTVVGPHDVWVLRPSAEATLTLITCYPFYSLGPAPQRFVVHAERVARDAPGRGVTDLTGGG